MTDIVERLRDQGKDAFAKHYSLGMFKLCADAADEIERLRNVAQPATALRDYLVQIRNVCRDNATESCNHRMALDYVHQLAAAALSSAERGTGEA